MCAFDCRVRLELFIIWVWEPLSSIDLIRPFLTAMKKLSLPTKHRALGFQKDSWSCGFQSLNITKVAVEHRGSFSDVPLVPMGPGFVDYVLSMVNADRAMRVVQVPGDDVEGVTELPSPSGSPLGTQVAIAAPTALKGKEASAEQSVESLEAKTQPSMATPTKEDTCPKVLIRGEWRKVPDGYPRDVSGQLERDQLFINDLAKQLVAELRAVCQINPNPGAKPKSSDTKADLIYKRASSNYLQRVHVLWAVFSSARLVYQWWSV